MTPTELRRAARDALDVQQFEFKVLSIKLAGWPSNLLLIGKRIATLVGR